jgi:hypothetical protein
MLSRRKPLAAMAALGTALAVAVPAATAGAAPSLPRPVQPISPAAMQQTCLIMGFQGQLVGVFANPVYANAQNQLIHLNGCAG